MRIIWFLPTDSRDFNNMSASVWIRALQLLPYLEALGIENIVNDPDAEGDIAIFVRRQDDATLALAKAQKRKGMKIVFDVCVNYFVESDAPENVHPVSAEHVRQCQNMADVADAITCASQNIFESASKFHSNAICLPDSIDGKHFNRIKPTDDFLRKKIRAVWSGVSIKAAELLPYMDLLEKYKIPLTIIADKRPIEFNHSFSFSKPKASFKKWKYETFPQSINSGEFMFAPRDVTTSYNQGHSSFKVGVFLAQGIPVLAGPVPSYHEVLPKGLCGALCESMKDYEDNIQMILDDRQQLVKWSKNAVQSMAPFSSEEVSKKYKMFFENLLP